MSKDTYHIIKKQNGERFAQSIRKYHNGIFDIPNIANIVKYAGRNAEPILKYLLNLTLSPTPTTNVTDTPFELLHRAGYNAVYADTLEKQNTIKKYFAPGEELCTFKDPERYKNYYIINAVRYDANKIQREHFINPQREDAYGTSVMSIQISKEGGFISIINRYNHTVSNPNNTYNSNPDNIIDGLSASLQKYFDVDFFINSSLPDSYILAGSQIVKYNYEINNCYFCPDCYVKNGKIHQINKSYQFMVDYFIFDLKQHCMINIADIDDCFATIFNNEIAGKTLTVTKQKDNKGDIIRRINANGIPIADVIYGVCTSLSLRNTPTIDNNFMVYNRDLKTINLLHTKYIGDSFLYDNRILDEINSPEILEIGHFCLRKNILLKTWNLPKIQKIGNCALFNNTGITEINMPTATEIGDFFLSSMQEQIKQNAIDVPNINAPQCPQLQEKFNPGR